MACAPVVSQLEIKAIREMTVENLAIVLDHPDPPADPPWLERAALMLLPAFDDPDMPDEARRALPDALEQRADEHAAAMLAALRSYGREPLARLAGAALRRLGERGIEPAGTGEPALGEVRQLRMGDGEMIVATLLRAGEASVQAALLELEHWDGGPIVVGGMLTEPAPSVELGTLLAGPVGEMAPLDAGELRQTLARAVEHMTRHDLPLPGELCAVMPLLARALTGETRALGELRYEHSEPGPADAPAEEPYVVDAVEDEDGFIAAVEELRERFEGYAKASIAPPSPVWEVGDFVVSSMLEWKGGYGDGRLVHWTRGAIAAYLIEHFPRKVSADDYLIERTPACVAAFVEFLAAEGLLAGDPVGALRGFADELAPEFEEACRDRANWGLAKSIGMQMIAEGVDPSDEQAVQAWMTGFNARTREERDGVVGPAADRMLAGVRPAPERPSVSVRRAKRKATKAARRRNRR